MERLRRAFEAKSTRRSRELERMGFSRKQILHATRNHLLERLGRGIYRLPETEMSEHDSLTLVATAVPNARFCLLSALRFHQTTTQNPHEVWIALGPEEWRPVLDYPKIRIHEFSGAALTEGLEEHVVQGVKLRVYSVAKTIVDLFRFRNKIGIDVALEALKDGWRERRFTMAEIDRLARLCRMKRVMAPYLEALVA
jgi:predicted transcriptional regulator of viral defense system